MTPVGVRPAVLVGPAPNSDTHAPVPETLQAWLRGEGPPPRAQAEPGAVVGAVDLPRHALLVASGLEVWTDLRPRLTRRRDIVAVAVLGRRPAFDWPEYLSGVEHSGWQALLDAKPMIVVSDEETQARLSSAMPQPGQARIVVDRSIPSRMAGGDGTARPGGNLPPYVVSLGPLGARANTTLLLHLWRDAASRDAPLTKLVLLGGRGALMEEVRPLLDWNGTLRSHVAEAGTLSATGLRQLLSASRAVLVPDFCVPDALLMRDALALGCRVLAADTPEARALGIGPLLSPIDGPGWRAAIRTVADAPIGAPRPVELPGWPAFLDSLRHLAGPPP